MQFQSIPVVAIGPGSQPVGEPLMTLDMPADMPTFRTPINDSQASDEIYHAALDILREVRGAMIATPYDSRQPARCSVAGRNRQLVAEVNDMLGEGEVSARSDALDVLAQETAFTGVWRVRGPGIDVIEAGVFPTLVRELAESRRMPVTRPVPPAEGLMNGASLFAEICDRSAAYRPGQEAHVVNLSLMPVTPEDHAFLDEALGRAGISILSRGFGNCRVTATAYPNVWWVQYFNAMDKLILNSVEIVDLPAAALAAREDYQDSIERLGEWIDNLASAR